MLLFSCRRGHVPAAQGGSPDSVTPQVGGRGHGEGPHTPVGMLVAQVEVGSKACPVQRGHWLQCWA